MGVKVFLRKLVYFLQPFSLCLPIWCYNQADLWCMKRQTEATASTACRGDLLILFLGEDWDARRLKDGDLHQSTVGLHRLPIVIGYHKQLQWARQNTHKQYTNANASTKLLLFYFFNHTTTHYTNNSFFEVARLLFL